MQVFNVLFLILVLAAMLAPVYATKPDFLNPRKRYHRHHCPHRRCMPLHSRVPFP
ncbi:apelin receptor early endogenous ligand [Nothobranchius furzeri]|uniref:Apelin receptor early endogenous ligand n=1 Tax=Nothobranchius furzeri TaxID=105023 RepID=A0A9D2Y7R2_NOTFU|nr:apelin receptor early endogenous ligand [Nothobranchius furzeri]KAF7214339.1 apelin receptor early endogenous ligand [Nothobranchius furzeri]